MSDPDEPATLSFEQYVATRSAALLRFAYLVTRNREDAHDAVQDALTGLFPRWRQVAARGQVDAYVRRSVVNAHVSRWRTVRRLVPAAEPASLLAAPTAQDPAARVADIDEALRLCGTLPPVQRAAVVLQSVDGHAVSEIAVILGCSEGAVEQRLVRARATLRERSA